MNVNKVKVSEAQALQKHFREQERTILNYEIELMKAQVNTSIEKRVITNEVGKPISA